MTAKTDRTPRRRAKSVDLDPAAIEATGALEPASSGDQRTQEDMDGPLGKRGAADETGPARRTRWERAESTFRMLSLIAIAVSAAVSALNFYQGYLDTKKERAIALMSQWQSSGARDTYASLGDVLAPAITDVGPIPSDLPEQAKQLVRKRIGADLLEALKSGNLDDQEGIATQIDTVVVFFSEIEFCLRAKLCDEALLKDYFGTEVTVFWDYFQTYAFEQRAGLYPTYGKAVEQLVASFGAR